MEDINSRETLFTKIVTGEIPASKVYEDEKHLAFLSIQPFERGHTVVIPKKPYQTLFEMPENEYLELQKVILKIVKHYKEVLNCDIAIAQKNGKIAEQDVPHAHFHVIPRKDSTKKFFNEKNYEKLLGNELQNISLKLKL